MESRPSRPEATSYAFGDTELAAERLELLADVFEPPSRSFLDAAAPRRPAIALDLGCGSGRTTALVAETTGAARIVGIDNSESFLARAAGRARTGVEFVRHDVTVPPLPAAPVDLVYARFVLSHLSEPETRLTAWAEDVRADGRLLLEEAEYMRTGNAVLNQYEDTVDDVVAARGATLLAGPLVAHAVPGPQFRRVFDRVVVWPVAEATAAQLYAMNLGTWRHDEYVTAHYSDDTLDTLADDLEAIAASGSQMPVEWGLRQVAFERHP